MRSHPPVGNPTNPAGAVGQQPVKRKAMRDHKATYTRLLEMIGDGYSLGEHPIGGTYIEFHGSGFNRICLYEYEKALQNTYSLVIFAGDTCAQARELFKHFSNVKALDLEKSGWTIGSHFHFAWQRKNILFTSGDKSLALSEYIDYWRWALAEGYIRKYNKNEFDLLLQRMRHANVMDDRDITEFNGYFRTHKYQSAITCPGIINRISYSKEKLNEDIGILAAELREKMISLVEIYNQNYVPTSKPQVMSNE